ncbi:hypothetical protein G6R40_01435 [Chryseobacterium sp. POL2]|uniref:hypothetical protein n=1 Tax=Chryseobacterium sp. POL2 TaxID=2713414 RepID=UPI0013E1185F|nr:hypothetical protein [Chryseobacterium sp. POL2]QIG88398.1 hypothetical protein G6R40_01435 [Chryseobacterium sp. POL2]
MNKVSSKIAMLSVLSTLTFGTIATSCSKDEERHDEVVTTKIDEAVGTYKGKLTSPNLDDYEHFDVVMYVTKVDDQHLKVTAKTGEAYSTVTSKTFKVENLYNGDIHNVSGILEGYFWYTKEVKTLEMGTQKQSATDVTFYFDGVKQ